MEQFKYNLHSVCIHDGSAIQGHYYSLIFDRFQDKWRKYNDIYVEDISE